jgi:hypothetical protein
MKKLFALALIAASGAAAAATDVNVSISAGAPNFYGRIDIGNMPQPQLVRAEPVIVVRPAPNVVVAEPLYLRVPPGHMKHWSKHCREYNACGQRVYFVHEDWYNNVYAPHQREHGEGRHEEHGEGHGRDKEHGHGHGHDKD